MNRGARVNKPDRGGLRRPHRGEDGFTLLELLVVITILGMLAALTGTVAFSYLSRAKTDTARLQIEQISAGLELFRLDVGRYPTQEEGLMALIERSSDGVAWNGPYLKKRKSVTDAWGRPFLYRNPGQNGEVDIYSLGSDNAEGGEGEKADVTNW